VLRSRSRTAGAGGEAHRRNCEVWAQKDSGAYLPLKVGDPVTILAGTLGSFRLISGNRATAVTRVQ
jgi:hypothetical protein